MNPLTLLHILEPITTAAARLYVVAGEVFTIAVLLHGLKLAAGLVEGTYNAGLVVGRFYRQHLHAFCKSAVLAIIALTIVIAQYAGLAVKTAWNDRMEYIQTLNKWRNDLGAAFAYQSPTFA